MLMANDAAKCDVDLKYSHPAENQWGTLNMMGGNMIGLEQAQPTLSSESSTSRTMVTKFPLENGNEKLILF